MDNKCKIIKDAKGNKIVQINNIIFKGKQNIDWKSVEKYLKQYINEIITITETKDIVYIGKDFPDEYKNSKYSTGLKGALAKAKANASQAILELVKISTNKKFQENYECKHNKNAKNGWYRFDTRFSLPIFDNDENLVKYNVYRARILIRCDSNMKKYLYDIINIKKETEYTALVE